MARVATFAPSVSRPAAASPAAAAPTAAPGRLAVVVPVAVLGGAFASNFLTRHGILGASVPRIQTLVQAAGLQIVSAGKHKMTQIEEEN